jgi:hypothetical protein
MAFGSKKRKEAEIEHEAPEHIDSGDEVDTMETDEGGEEEEETAVQNPTKTQLLLDQVTILSSGKGKNPGGSKSWQCKHCKKTFSSTLTRIGMHFFGAGAGKKAQISRCQALQANRAKYKELYDKVGCLYLSLTINIRYSMFVYILIYLLYISCRFIN